MKLYEIVFSPTGGTEKVSQVLAGALSDDVTAVNLLDSSSVEKCSLTEKDVAVISVPSFGGRVPSAAAERIGMIQANGAEAVITVVYGNRAYEDTLKELEDTAEKAGFRVVAAVAAVAEHSIVRQVAQGRPDEADNRQLLEFAEKIKEKLSAGSAEKPEIPGNRPYKEYKGVGMVPKASKNCISCGVCAAECPVGAIDADDPGKVDEKKCISCMRCVSVCPHSARKVSKVMLTAAGMMLKKACADRKENELFI